MICAKAGWQAILGAVGRMAGPLSPFLACGLLIAALVLPAPTRALESLELRAPGASAELIETLRASSLLLASQQAGQTSPDDLMPVARAEYGRLIELLYEHGYFAPTIRVLVDGREAAQMSPLSTPARIDTVAIDIALGPVFTFGTVDIAPLAPATVLPDGFAPGQPARSTVLRAALATALDGWRAQGHPYVEAVSQNVVANHAAQRLDVRLTLAPGPQLRIGAVVPQGNVRTHDERIVAIAGLPEGALHTPEALADAGDRLRTTGAFASVVLRTAEHANPDGTVDVEARVDEALPRRLGFGVEYDTEAGVRLSGFWLHRNLLGAADRLRLEAAMDGIVARTGGLGFSLDALYTRPATLNRDTSLELGLRALRHNERDFQADAFEADARLVRRYSRALRASVGIALRFERADYGPGLATTGDFGTLGIPLSVTHETRDVPLDARRGHYLWVDAMPYLGFNLTRRSLRLRFDARQYADLGTDGRVVLAARVQGGAILGGSLADTPRGFLFYSGGGGTVRGMPYQSLGVTSALGDSGGRSFVGLSGEVRGRASESLSLAAFADVGYVASGVFNGFSDWHAGGGFGIRYMTPIGPLRLDLATPLRRNATAQGSSAYQIYLGIGQAF